MNEAIEAVLKHWGETVRCGAPSGGLASPAGTLMEWQGCIPRCGGGGSRMLLAGAGPDFLASEVSAALAVVAGGEDGEQLRLLASRRYTFEPALSVDEQVHDLALGRGDAGRRAYTRLVQRLHQVVLAELTARQGERKARLRAAQRDGDRVRQASVQQAARAHRGRGLEFEEAQGGRGAIAVHKARKAAACGSAVDRSSGDSAPVGSGAPRQAPVRNDRK